MYPSWPNIVPPDPESSGSMAATTIKQRYLLEESMPRVDLIFVYLHPKLAQFFFWIIKRIHSVATMHLIVSPTPQNAAFLGRDTFSEAAVWLVDLVVYETIELTQQNSPTRTVPLRGSSRSE
jgi:hypothetical protein